MTRKARELAKLAKAAVFICGECAKEFSTVQGLALHTTRAHRPKKNAAVDDGIPNQVMPERAGSNIQDGETHSNGTAPHWDILLETLQKKRARIDELIADVEVWKAEDRQ